MRRLICWMAVVGVAIAFGASPVSAQCRTADSTSQRMIQKWRSLMVSTDPYVRLALTRNGLSQVDSSTVVLVNDRNACSKAAKAYNSVLGAGARPPSGSVYVIKVGSAYVVRDPVQQGGEFAADVVLDSGFKVKAHPLG